MGYRSTLLSAVVADNNIKSYSSPYGKEPKVEACHAAVSELSFLCLERKANDRRMK